MYVLCWSNVWSKLINVFFLLCCRYMIIQVILLVSCGVVTYSLANMMRSHGNTSHQGKIISLFMVIVVVGVILITTSYHGLLQRPFQAIGLFNVDTLAQTGKLKLYLKSLNFCNSLKYYNNNNNNNWFV